MYHVINRTRSAHQKTIIYFTYINWRYFLHQKDTLLLLPVEGVRPWVEFYCSVFVIMILSCNGLVGAVTMFFKYEIKLCVREHCWMRISNKKIKYGVTVKSFASFISWVFIRNMPVTIIVDFLKTVFSRQYFILGAVIFFIAFLWGWFLGTWKWVFYWTEL